MYKVGSRLVSVCLLWFKNLSERIDCLVFGILQNPLGASQVALVVKNLLANPGDIKDAGLITGLGGSPGGEHGNLHQHSCLENPMDRGAWWATVHRVTKSKT